MNVIVIVAICVCLPAIYGIALGVQRRRVPTWLRHPIRARAVQQSKVVLVTGATGFVGRQFCRTLLERGDRLIVLTRKVQRASNLYGPHASIVSNLDQIDAHARIDAIVNLAGAPIMGALWTKRRRQLLLSSRLKTTEALVALIARLHRKPEVLVSMSAIGYYGVRGDEEITEADRGRPVFQSHLCQAWELAAQHASRYGVRVCRLRAGLVFGGSGGALPRLALSARMHLRVTLGAGRQWLSWIHLDDLVRMIERCVEDRSWSGAFNATAPEPVRQSVFARELADRFGRSLPIVVPTFALRALLGEMSQLLADGQRVIPFAAHCKGFQFRHPALNEALADIFPKTRSGHLDSGAQILYDPVCPVCDLEMRRYCRDASRAGMRWTFADGAASPEVMSECGIDSATARRRVYIVDASGRIHSGLDAIALIWATLPRWKWLARIVRLPIANHLANLIYDVLLAPLIWRWSTARRARGVRAEVLTSS